MYGATCKEAIQNSLIEGLRQVRGVNLETQTISAINSLEVTDGDDYFKGESKVSLNVSDKTQGFVKSYNIDSLTEKKPGCDATVSMVIPYLKTKNDFRRKIVVEPFRVKHRSYSMGRGSISATTVSREFTQNIIEQLNQSRKFNLLNRDYSDEYNKEKLLIKSGEVRGLEKIKLGQQYAADHLIVGTIKAFSIWSNTQEYYGVSKTTRGGRFSINYRVIDIASNSIKWSDTIVTSLNSGSNLTMKNNLLQITSKKLASQILNVIYPVKVLTKKITITNLFKSGWKTH